VRAVVSKRDWHQTQRSRGRHRLHSNGADKKITKFGCDRSWESAGQSSEINRALWSLFKHRNHKCPSSLRVHFDISLSGHRYSSDHFLLSIQNVLSFHEFADHWLGQGKKHRRAIDIGTIRSVSASYFEHSSNGPSIFRW
jgi:hypothetical protein